MADKGPSGKVQHNDSYYFDNIVLMTPTVKGKCTILPLNKPDRVIANIFFSNLNRE